MMSPQAYLTEYNRHLSYLYAFARQINELDFAASLSGEFRGMQDAGWDTTITANEVFNELTTLLREGRHHSKPELRVMLLLYCQLAEAGGFYETLKNMMGVIAMKPYVLWPFQDLVRVREAPRRIIGPNANKTFRDLATTAKTIGLSRLSSLIEEAFRDDVRNGVSHADYIIWDDGLRLRRRNGGFAQRLSFDEVGEAVTRGLGFFQLIWEHNAVSIRSFDPPKEIVGQLSANFPMPWTVSFDPNTGAFGFRGSSPGPVTTPEYSRQTEINRRLGGKILAVFGTEQTDFAARVDAHILAAGFEPHSIALDTGQFRGLVQEVEALALWDRRKPHANSSEVLLASPWGFRWIHSTSDFDEILERPIVELTWDDAPVSDTVGA